MSATPPRPAASEVKSVAVRPAGGIAPARQHFVHGEHFMHGRRSKAAKQLKKLHAWARGAKAREGAKELTPAPAQPKPKP